MSRWGLLGLVLVACEPLPPTSMAEIDFPEGFRLDAHAEVVLLVEAPAGTAPDGRIVVRTPEGSTLFEGSAALVARRGLGLRVPPATRSLEVAWSRDGEVVEATTVAIVDTRATWRPAEVR